jgi:hypothetical protein
MQPEFLPPSATLTEPRLKPRSSVVAVLLGGLGVNVLGAIAIVAFVSALANRSGNRELPAALQSRAFLITTMAITGLRAIAAGYVAARWARRRPVAHGLAAGTLSLVLSLLLYLVPGASDRMWVMAATLIAQLPLAALGGYLAGRRMT